MVKFLVTVIGILLLFLIVLFFMYKSKKKKLEDTKVLYEDLHDDYVTLENMCFKLKEEKKIEIEQKDKLIKKLADIGYMSVDDIMHQLQNKG